MFRGITWWRLVFRHPRHPTSISSASRLAASFILSVLLLMRSFRVASSFLSLFCVRLTLECHFGAFASWSSTASSFQFTDLLHGECSFVASLLLLLFLFHPVCFFFYLAFARNFHFTFFFMFVPFVWCTVLNQFLFSLYFRQRHQIGMERCVRHSNEESERECGNNLNYYDDDILLLHQSIGIVRCGDNDIVQTENVNWKRARKISSCVCVCMCVGATSTQMAKAETHECDCTENWFDEQESYLAFYLWIYSFLPQLECKIFPQMNWKTSRCGGGGGFGETTHS